jgi:MFS family permease
VLLLSCPKKSVSSSGLRFFVSSMFLGALDQTIIATALPAIAGSFGGLSYFAWVVTAYLLAATVAVPMYGRMGDAFGRKRMLLWALGLFVVGSAAKIKLQFRAEFYNILNHPNLYVNNPLRM